MAIMGVAIYNAGSSHKVMSVELTKLKGYEKSVTEVVLRRASDRVTDLTVS